MTVPHCFRLALAFEPGTLDGNACRVWLCRGGTFSSNPDDARLFESADEATREHDHQRAAGRTPSAFVVRVAVWYANARAAA